MSRSWTDFRRHVGYVAGQGATRIERSSTMIARGIFSNFKVDGPEGPFHWAPAAAQTQTTPFDDSTFNAYPPVGIRGVPTEISIDTDIMPAAVDGTAILGWRFHITATNIGPDVATGTVHLQGNFMYPSDIARVREGFFDLAWRIDIHSFPLIMYCFPAKRVGDTTQIVPYLRGDGAQFELFAPQFAADNAIFSSAQAVTLQNDTHLPDLLPLLREQVGVSKRIVEAAEQGDALAYQYLALGGTDEQGYIDEAQTRHAESSQPAAE